MRGRSRLVFVSSVLILSVAGCVSSVEPRSTRGERAVLTLGPSHAQADDAKPCVMEVPGTGIHMHEIEGGLAVTFDTVARPQVAALRGAVRRFGDELVHGHAGHHHQHITRAAAIARRFRAQHGALPALRADVRDVGRGAVLELRAADASQVELVRTELRAEIGVMQRGVCPLLDGAR